MSLKAKIEAVIYASEEPVTLQQLVSLLGQEAQAELDAAAALQGQLALLDDSEPARLAELQSGDEDALNAETLGDGGLSPVESPGGDPAEIAPVDSTADSAIEAVPDVPGGPSPAEQRARERRLREYVRSVLDALIAEYGSGDRGLEIREVAGGFRFATKPEYHDAVRGFVRSLKPPLKLSLQALETLAVVAYKQPVTAPEVSEVRGVDSGGVLGSLLARKLVTTAGRKQVIGRPILYKTTKEFLLRFGLRDVAELPSIEEFERMASDLNEAMQEEIPMPPSTDSVTGEQIDDVALAGERHEPRATHEAQADGIPNREAARHTDAENLSPAPDGPGEFTGNENAPPVDNVEIDGRISGLPPSYDESTDEGMDSPANDAAVQAEQMENAGSDD